MTIPAMTSDKGVILSIGIVVDDDRCELVFPCATDAALTVSQLCNAACSAAQLDLFPLLCDCLSAGSHISFVQACGMDNGYFPYRADFAAGIAPGTVESDALPASIGGIMIFYGDPAGAPAGSRLRVSKSIVPGVPASMLAGQYLDQEYVDALHLLMVKMMDGFSAIGTLLSTWHRVMAAPKSQAQGGVPASPLQNIGQCIERGYIGHQRRRNIPH